MATTYEVHPAIGVARVGSSPDYFLAPEPGTEPPATYRDKEGDLLRQAARFRVFRCERDTQGNLVEATQIPARTVRWTVHVVNAKGAAPLFPPPVNLPPDQWPLRNPTVSDRAALTIDPGPRSLHGADGGAVLDGGTFLGRPVDLGEIRTDGDGNLVVLGGLGRSQSVTPNGIPAPITHFANNDTWCDDVGDGSVRAEVTLEGGEVIEAEPAWLIVGPPDFAPPVSNLITLYDVAYQVAVDQKWLHVESPPSFTRHIYPVLSRAIGYSWVTRYGRAGHGSGVAGDFTVRWAELANPQGDPAIRQRIVERLRDPNQPPPHDMPITAMPRLHDETNSTLVLPLTPAQYARLEEWAAGNFMGDWQQSPLAVEALPDALTRTALESCSGGAFYPGIEAGRIMKESSLYSKAFRLNPLAVSPGDLTKGNAVPWQADFTACEWEDHAQIGWWPAQRPDEVYADETLSQMREWADGAENYEDMVAQWHRLGLVLRRVRPDGQEIFIEQERTLPR